MEYECSYMEIKHISATVYKFHSFYKTDLVSYSTISWHLVKDKTMN
jgi:hypothetical protein